MAPPAGFIVGMIHLSWKSQYFSKLPKLATCTYLSNREQANSASTVITILSFSGHQKVKANRRYTRILKQAFLRLEFCLATFAIFGTVSAIFVSFLWIWAA